MIGTKGAVSLNFLVEDHGGVDDCDTSCNEIELPLPYPEVESYPPTDVGSG